MKNLFQNYLETHPKSTKQKVNRFEYEAKNLNTKLDIADIYIQLKELKDALAEHNIEVKAMPYEEREAQAEKLVLQDESVVAEIIGDVIYRDNQRKRLSEKNILDKARNWVDTRLMRHSDISDEILNYVDERIEENLDKEDDTLINALAESLIKE